MKNFFQKLWAKLRQPRGFALFALYLATAAFCVAAIVLALSSVEGAWQILSYVVYGVAGVTLAYSVYTVVIYASSLKQNLFGFIKKNVFGRRMLENYGFRTIVFAACSMTINVAYVVFHVVLAVWKKSLWYGSLATYYAMLVALRSGLVIYHKNKRRMDEEEQKRLQLRKYRKCGVLLTIIPLCLTVPVLQVAFLGKAFVHEGWTVIAFAAYAFYKIIMAAYNLIKSRKQEDLTIQAVRNVSFADALTSIFSLQTALLFAFSEGNYAVANVATGCAAGVLTIALGVSMLVNASKIAKENKTEE